MLSITEFSDMCQLPARTLRYYHSEGLLVPADVDEQTGYRRYTFAQVERAMLVTVLRATGMGVQSVRLALENPNTAPGLLDEHGRAVARRRRQQDQALADARSLVREWPQVHRGCRPAMTVLSTLTPAVLPARRADSSSLDGWERVDAATADQVRWLTGLATSRGVQVAGPPWRTEATETPQQKRDNVTAGGPHWVVKLPVAVHRQDLAGLPEGVDVQHLDAGDEISLHLPGPSSTVRYATALARLLAHPLPDAFVDLGQMRHVLHHEGVETAVAVVPLDEDPRHTVVDTAGSPAPTDTRPGAGTAR